MEQVESMKNGMKSMYSKEYNSISTKLQTIRSELEVLQEDTRNINGASGLFESKK